MLRVSYCVLTNGVKYEAPAWIPSKPVPAMVRVLRPARFRDRRLQNAIRWTVIRRRSGLTVVPSRVSAEEAAEIIGMQRAARAAEDLRRDQARAAQEAREVRSRERAARLADYLRREQERQADDMDDVSSMDVEHEYANDVTTYIATPLRNENLMIVRGVRYGAVHLNVRLPSHDMARLPAEFLHHMASIVNEAIFDYFLRSRAAGA